MHDRHYMLLPLRGGDHFHQHAGRGSAPPNRAPIAGLSNPDALNRLFLSINRSEI